jgi:hypothetical protein
MKGQSEIETMRLGVRVKSSDFGNNDYVAARGLVEVFDVETGQIVKGVKAVNLELSVDGLLSVEMKFYPARIEGVSIEGVKQ